jgi:hypothetical protein
MIARCGRCAAKLTNCHSPGLFALFALQHSVV